MDALQRWPDRRRACGLLAGFVVPLYVFLAALAVAVAVGCALWKGLAPGASGGCSLHVGTALAGSSEVFARDIAPGCSELTLDEARATIAWDFAFILVYAPLGTALLWWLWPRAWRIRSWRERRWVAFTFAAGALLDVVENVLVLFGLRDGLALSEGLARAAAVAGWWKWMLVGAGVAATAAALCGAVANRRVPPPPGRAPARPPDEPGAEMGICLSGGGIRSAAFALGALRALDRHGLFRRSRWITAVSGGAYTAGAWHVARRSAAEAPAVTPPPDGDHDRLLEPPAGAPDLFAYLRANRRYLSTGRGGLPATFLTGAGLIAFNVLVLATLVCLLAWPAGRVAASWAIEPELRGFTYGAADAQSVAVELRQWLPGAAGFAAALVLFVVSLFLWDPARKRILTAAAFFAGGSVLLLALMAAAPVAMAEVPNLWAELPGGPLQGSAWASAAVVVALVVAVARLLLRPFAAKAARLGGVLLGVLAFLFAGRVATDAAYGDAWFAWSPGKYALVAAAFALLYALADAQSWSWFRLYWLRLRSTFTTTQDASKRARHAPVHEGVYPLSVAGEPVWPEYRGRPGPRLLVCAAAQSSDAGVSGIPARSFTFSAEEVALRDGSFGAVTSSDEYLRLLRARHLGTVSASVAASGAAFTSAMGRQSLGTTNALLAALNVRLGAWMPNPRYVRPDGRPLKKTRITYLLKEVFGVYDPDDPYVYVTDGGHWENLGLVELIRRRTRWIFCVDASGDPADSFATLEEAIAMARAECGAEIDLDPQSLRRRDDGRLPKTAVKTGVIRYHHCGGTGADDCPTGLLFYGKAMLAQDSPLHTLSFSLRDRIYPRYPTYDQFLSDDEFMNLVRLGAWIGRGLALDFERFRPPDVPGIPMAGPSPRR